MYELRSVWLDRPLEQSASLDESQLSQFVKLSPNNLSLVLYLNKNREEAKLYVRRVAPREIVAKAFEALNI